MVRQGRALRGKELYSYVILCKGLYVGHVVTMVCKKLHIITYDCALPYANNSLVKYVK